MALEWGDNEISWGKFGQIITTSLRSHWKWSLDVVRESPKISPVIDGWSMWMPSWWPDDPVGLQKHDPKSMGESWYQYSLLICNVLGNAAPVWSTFMWQEKSGLGFKFGGRQVKKQLKNMAHVWAHVHMIDSFQSWIHPRFPLTHQSHWEIFDHNIEWCRHRIHWLIIIFPVFGVFTQKSSEVTMVWCLNQVQSPCFWLKSPWCSWWFPGRPALLCNGQGFGTWDVQGNGGMNPPNDVVLLRKKDDKSLELGMLPDKPNGFWCFGLVNFVWIPCRIPHWHPSTTAGG